jgi:hypothetical protein
MAWLQGVSPATAYVTPPPASVGANARGTINGGSPNTQLPAVIDGTPVRVAVLALSAAAGLFALHAAGFRFSIGVSG